jgi:hypothetical protein
MSNERTKVTARVNTVWMTASALTITSWAIARSRAGRHPSASIAEAVVALALAGIKARLIIQEFMEVRSAPIWLRRVTDLWLAGLWAAILVMYRN